MASTTSILIGMTTHPIGAHRMASRITASTIGRRPASATSSSRLPSPLLLPPLLLLLLPSSPLPLRSRASTSAAAAACASG